MCVCVRESNLLSYNTKWYGEPNWLPNDTGGHGESLTHCLTIQEEIIEIERVCVWLGEAHIVKKILVSSCKYTSTNNYRGESWHELMVSELVWLY